MKEAVIKFYKAYPSFILTFFLVAGVWAFNYLDKKMDKFNDKLEAANEKITAVNEQVIELKYAIKYSRAVLSYENQVYADSLRKAIASQSSLIKNIPHRINKNTNTKADSVVHNMERLFVDNVLSKGVFRRNSTNDFKEYPFNYFQK